MMKAVNCYLAVIALAAANPSFADLENAALDTDLSYGYGYTTSESMQGVLELKPKAEIAVADSITIVASARVRLDAQDELEPGKSPLETYAPASRPLAIGNAGSAELRDVYVEFRSRHGLARIGKQQIVWGRLDGIKVLDLVNPQSFREFVMADFGDSRIGLWSAYLDYTLGAWRTEFALVMDGTGHEIPEPGAWFELTAPRFRFGAPTDSATAPVTTATPQHGLDDIGLGFRASRNFGRLAVSGVAYSGLDSEPLGRATDIAGNPGIERFYERRDVFGVSAETGLGTLVLRAEYAYQPNRTFNERTGPSLTTRELDQHRGAIGLDVSAPFGIFVNLQYLLDTIDSAPDGLIRPKVDRIATLYLRRSFGYDALTLEARWYHSFEDDDDLASLRLDYRLQGNTTLQLALESFSGVGAGLFGQFNAHDRVVVGIAHRF